jgi:hypothetical protein
LFALHLLASDHGALQEPKGRQGRQRDQNGPNERVAYTLALFYDGLFSCATGCRRSSPSRFDGGDTRFGFMAGLFFGQA